MKRALLIWLLAASTALPAVGQEPASGPPQSPPGDETAAKTSSEEPASEDRAITRLLRQRFEQIEGLAKVEVEVRYGVAQLEGTALGFADAERAVTIAEKTEGVIAVEDRIEIETDLEERVAPAYSRSLERLRDIASYVPLFAIGALILVLFAFLSRLLGGWDALFQRISPNTFVQDLARQVAQAIVLVIGILITLEILDATALVGAVLGSVGVLGLAVGFAFRDLVENYISSVLLSLRRPFSPNDHVVIGSHEGKVVRLTSRATILMTLDGNHLRIPNSDVFKGVILNYTRNPERRFQFDVGVGVEEDLLEAQRLGLEQLTDLSGVLDHPEPEAIIVELGDSNVVIRFYGWVDQRASNFLKVKAEAIRRVKVRLETAGMDLPEPIYRVVVRRPDRQPEKPAPSETTTEETPDLTAGEAIDEHIARERAAEEDRDLLDPSSPEE